MIRPVERFNFTLFLFTGSPAHTFKDRAQNGWLHFLCVLLFSIEPWILKVAPGTELGIMPMEGRKVIYDTGLPDGKGGVWYSLLEPNENTKREGIFLRFGERTIYVEEEKQHFCNTVAIVEDLETGQILVLPPENIKFENN